MVCPPLGVCALGMRLTLDWGGKERIQALKSDGTKFPSRVLKDDEGLTGKTR